MAEAKLSLKPGFRGAEGAAAEKSGIRSPAGRQAGSQPAIIIIIIISLAGRQPASQPASQP